MNPWWQSGLTAGLGLVATAGAFLGGKLGVRANDRATTQRDLAARREEWWRRFTWAAELALDESSAKRVCGLKLLAKLSQSELAQRDECLLLDVFQGRVLDKLLDDLPSHSEGGSQHDEPTTAAH